MQLVEHVGDGTLELESDGKLEEEGGEGVHFNSLLFSDPVLWLRRIIM